MITTEQIRKLIEDKKVTIGTDITTRALKAGELKSLVIASNASADTRDQITRLASINGTPLDDIQVPNDELGTMCKKPFAISVLGIKR